MKFSQNEAKFVNDKIGFINTSINVQSFLTLDSLQHYSAKERTSPEIIVDGYKLFQLRCIVELTNVKHLYSRQANTFLNLLGDYGGFHDAVFMIFAFFMSYYSEVMYMIAISHEFNFAMNPSPERLTQLNLMHSTLKSG